MKHLFKTNIFKDFLSVLIIFLFVKFLWVGASLLWFSSKGVNHEDGVNNKSLYYRVKLTPNESSVPVKVPKKKLIVGDIKDISLKAVYNSSDTTVVTILYKRKTKIMGRGDSVNGFVLTGGGSRYAIFEKDGKSYRVDLLKRKNSSHTNSHIRASTPTVKAPSVAKDKVEGEIVDAGDHIIVDKSLLTHYANNMDDIYKNIGITEVKEGGAVKGFKITFVKRGSPFAKLGVRRGDIIKSMNGQEINSYNAAFQAYKNIGNVENLTLVIQRGKEEMELEYEIN